MADYVVSAVRFIPVPPKVLYQLVADPTRHHEIDGSGTVLEAEEPTRGPLKVGDTFGMRMHHGIFYSMRSTVVEAVPNKRFAWASGPTGRLAQYTGGRIWRYDFAVSKGGTVVTESWDVTKDRQGWLFARSPLVRMTKANMEATLARMEELVVATSGASSVR